MTPGDGRRVLAEALAEARHVLPPERWAAAIFLSGALALPRHPEWIGALLGDMQQGEYAQINGLLDELVSAIPLEEINDEPA